METQLYIWIIKALPKVIGVRPLSSYLEVPGGAVPKQRSPPARFLSL